jgi:hypothetical protein
MIQVLVAEKCQLLMIKKCQSPKNVCLFNILRLFLMVKIEGICTCLRGADGGRSGGADVAIEVATMQNWPSLVLPVVSPLLLSLSCDYQKNKGNQKNSCHHQSLLLIAHEQICLWENWHIITMKGLLLRRFLRHESGQSVTILKEKVIERVSS